jgi:hypothetical protein
VHGAAVDSGISRAVRNAVGQEDRAGSEEPRRQRGDESAHVDSDHDLLLERRRGISQPLDERFFALFRSIRHGCAATIRMRGQRQSG